MTMMPADVAQAQLADDLAAGLEVGLERGVFEQPPAHVAAGVDVDDRHGLGVVDDDVAARGQAPPAGPEPSDLLSRPKRSNRGVGRRVELHPVRQLGGHGPQVVHQPPVQLLVVHDDRAELGAQRSRTPAWPARPRRRPEQGADAAAARRSTPPIPAAGSAGRGRWPPGRPLRPRCGRSRPPVSGCSSRQTRPQPLPLRVVSRRDTPSALPPGQVDDVAARRCPAPW